MQTSTRWAALALVALLASIGALGFTLSQSDSSDARQVHDRIPDAIPAVQQSTSRFSQPESECDSEVVVFAMNVDRENHTAFLDLPVGVYLVSLMADGDVDLGPFNTSKRGDLTTPSWPFISTESSTDWEYGDSRLLSRSLIRDGDRDITAWDGRIQIPGGIIRLSVRFFGYPKELDEWHRSSQWRWEIISPGICKAPILSADD